MTDLSVDARLFAPEQARTSQLPSIDRSVVTIGLAALTAGAIALGTTYSGTLYTAGGGNTRMLVTLAAFIIGSAFGALHLPWWCLAFRSSKAVSAETPVAKIKMRSDFRTAFLSSPMLDLAEREAEIAKSADVH